MEPKVVPIKKSSPPTVSDAGTEPVPERQAALDYHAHGRPGKLEVVPTKPVTTQHDLSLAYSPGVAEPCREIHRDRSMVGRYTGRRNLVAVVSNGTAVLGLGDIGPYAAKPVMEGKAVLFKRFADIDVFDIEVDAKDPERLIETVAALEPTFGGINLEDIKAPECFIVEKALKMRMAIPVFHDDQHGTAIISAAALLNGLTLQQRKAEELQVVCVGAGASAIACMDLWIKIGVRRENITMLDSRGIIRDGRAGVGPYKAPFARPADDPRRTLADALKGADVLIGLSSGGSVSTEMIMPMAERPMIFALANPDPEIPYDDALAARPDAIVATGRSDFPNQVNNVLGFPFIFRGALDVAATSINEAMKLAAAHALADLAREPVPSEVEAAYGGEKLAFGPGYIIPKPFDARVLPWVSSAVAAAAMETGVAQEPVDLEQYRERLSRKAGL
ncbi:MAG: NAD-dependent malic enzyme [Myxococcales bacterium]|nr:NAD-dependent malic enzyme [Myxococcales bacterium]